MAKTIKFNLNCNNKSIRTIEDLRENFSIEDILGYYSSGLLSKWLKVRGYESELKKINNINDEDDIAIIKKLISIFGIETDKKKVEEDIYILRYIAERNELYGIYEKRKAKINSIIYDYLKGYEQLVQDILLNPNDISIIKANIKEIASNYMCIFDYNYRELYWKLRDGSELAIMCLLMNENTREYFLIESSDIKEIADEAPQVINGVRKCRVKDVGVYVERESLHSTLIDKDKNSMYLNICNLIADDAFIEKLGENVHTFSGMTDGYWKDLETKDKKYMIISIDSGDFVRSAGKKDGDYDYNMVKSNFVILDGIDYKSNNIKHRIVYMEV